MNESNHGSNPPQLSKRILAQRARRERERINPSTPITPLPIFNTTPNQYSLGQRARRERELMQHRLIPPVIRNSSNQLILPTSVQVNHTSSTTFPNMSRHASTMDVTRNNQSQQSNFDRNFISTTQNFLQTHKHNEEYMFVRETVLPRSQPSSSQAVNSLRPSRRSIGQRSRRERERDTPLETNNIEPIIKLPDHHYLGRMDVRCNNCNALHWIDERLTHSSMKNPLFGSCCLQGKVKLPSLSPLSPSLQSLYEGSDQLSRSFREFIRSYNAANAFSSLGVKINDRVLNGRGPRSFTIHGQLHHNVGSLLPEPDKNPSYAQLYIYDAHTALNFRQQRNPHLRRDVLDIVQETLLQSNQLCKVYKHAYEILNESNAPNNEVYARLHHKPGTDKRRYNLPTTDEIAVILPGDGSVPLGCRDIVLRLRGNGLERISECHPLYLPSHYVLLFPNGDLGWSLDTKLWDTKTNDWSSKHMSLLKYHAYRLFERYGEKSSILQGGALFQEYICDAWAAYEQNRLDFLKRNQDIIRAEVYTGLTDIVRDGMTLDQIGQRFILPSKHIGSPRHMYEIYQDSMAITRYNKHPDVFLTMTANPSWREIEDELKPYQTSCDRPDLVARVFELKRKALMNEIVKKQLFGEVAAYVFTIEFQKRGLPHMHALIFLKQPHKINTCAQVDKIVSAEFPDPTTQPTLFETIKRCMIHGPCGKEINPFAPCMEKDKCTKRFPRDFVEKTTMDGDGYPLYKRSDTGLQYEVNGVMVDNRNVVPYNPHLSAMFDAHINVEVCASVRAVKYIHKYIYKGYDKATMVFVNGADEIQNYIDARFIGSAEAACRILRNPMHKEWPNVVRLALHLPGMQRVPYNTNETPEQVQQRAENQQTTLTAFFKYYNENPNAPAYTYQEFPEHFVWEKDGIKQWTVRDEGVAIGRVYFAGPNSGERFYLRLLLTIVKGPKSFEDLKKVGNEQFDTFKEACIARGILEDDEEWKQCLEEASTMKTGHQLRKLFSVILLECAPTQPGLLWNKFAPKICDDCAYLLQKNFQIQNPTLEQTLDYGLYLLQKIILEADKHLSDIPGMPLPVRQWEDDPPNRFITEQEQFLHEGSQEETQENLSRLNMEQLCAFNKITDSTLNNKGKVFFLNGPAGTGKTFVYNTIASACRLKGKIVVMIASSGVASLLLTGGRTAHSTFKLPLEIMDNSICGFTKNSERAIFLKHADLIIWDEVPMQHKYCVEAVERTLQDIRDNPAPFGGLTVVLGGDFRQTLPVITKGVREDFVAASLRRSQLWQHVEVLHLTHNMRLDGRDPDNITFAKFLMEVGTNANDTVELPNGIKKHDNLEGLIDSVYPGLQQSTMNPTSYLTDRTILSARNDDVSKINDATLNKYPGEAHEYLAADTVLEDDINYATQASDCTTEFLNSLDPSCLPPFNLRLKVGCPIMLLRNIAPRDGLCNGTRLKVLQCGTRVIEALILTGNKVGDRVFIPRITLTPSTSEMPFKMSRRQFPARLAYAMTINKSQGQSVKYVGIDLRTSVFSHGQLYVALSRCTSSKRISVILPDNGKNSTANVVYPEVLIVLKPKIQSNLG